MDPIRLQRPMTRPRVPVEYLKHASFLVTQQHGFMASQSVAAALTRLSLGSRVKRKIHFVLASRNLVVRESKATTEIDMGTDHLAVKER